MLIPFGVFSAGAGATYTNAYELIQTITLGSAASSFTFSSIPGTYKHLQVRGALKPAGSGYGFGLQLNGDTGNNYSMHRLTANSSGMTSSSATSTNNQQLFGFTVGVSTGTTIPVIVDILDYASTTKNKTMRALVGQAVSGAFDMHLSSGARYNTAAVTSVFLGAGGNFDIGSRLSLYGIKG
jgi:hypothetical protein